MAFRTNGNFPTVSVLSMVKTSSSESQQVTRKLLSRKESTSSRCYCLRLLLVCGLWCCSHLVSNFLILLFCVFCLLQQPLCPVSAASWCLWGVLYQPLGQVSEVDHLRLQGPETLLLTSQPLQAFSTTCLNGKEGKMNCQSLHYVLIITMTFSYHQCHVMAF